MTTLYLFVVFHVVCIFITFIFFMCFKNEFTGKVLQKLRQDLQKVMLLNPDQFEIQSRVQSFFRKNRIQRTCCITMLITSVDINEKWLTSFSQCVNLLQLRRNGVQKSQLDYKIAPLADNEKSQFFYNISDVTASNRYSPSSSSSCNVPKTNKKRKGEFDQSASEQDPQDRELKQNNNQTTHYLESEYHDLELLTSTESQPLSSPQNNDVVMLRKEGTEPITETIALPKNTDQKTSYLILDFDGVLAIPNTHAEQPYPQAVNKIMELSKSPEIKLLMVSYNPKSKEAVKSWGIAKCFMGIRAGSNKPWDGVYTDDEHRKGLSKVEQIRDIFQHELSADVFEPSLCHFFDDTLANVQLVQNAFPEMKTTLVDSNCGFIY